MIIKSLEELLALAEQEHMLNTNNVFAIITAEIIELRRELNAIKKRLNQKDD